MSVLTHTKQLGLKDTFVVSSFRLLQIKLIATTKKKATWRSYYGISAEENSVIFFLLLYF